MIEWILKLSMEIALQIIFSQFDEKIGPFPFVSYPTDISRYTLSNVSSVTIDLFTYSKKISEELVIMTFPQAKKKGLVTIAGKPSSELAPGTLNSIFKQAGLK